MTSYDTGSTLISLKYKIIQLQDVPAVQLLYLKVNAKTH